MSIVPKETIEVIAQSLGINNFSPDVLSALASDVEYRVREIMQEAIKCMRHSRRTTLSTDDVDTALSIRNVEPIYGFASCDPRRFKRALGHMNLFYIDEKDVDFKDVIEAPLPKAPLDTAVVAHWLAIEGVQPCIPENPPLQALAPPSDNMKAEYKEDGVPVELKLPVKHVLSRELQLYFEKITELTLSKSSSVLFKEALVSLASDSGLHPLVPYFTYFVVDEVTRNMNDFHLLFSLMRLVWSLLQNPHIHVDPYLHQLMPAVVTCLVAKRLGNKLLDNHWELRNFAADLVALICKRHGHAYHTLQPRLTRTFLRAFLDPTKSLPQHFGAIQGLAALGPSVVRLLLLPNLEPYLRLLEPEMQLEKQKNEMKRLEAWNVHGALMRAVGLCIYDRLKLIPSVLLPPVIAPWTSSRKILTASSSMENKWKPSMDNAEQPPMKKLSTEGPVAALAANSVVEIAGASVDNTQQPPLKKLSTEGPVAASAANSMADMSQASVGCAPNTVLGDSDFSSMSRTMSKENVMGIRGRRELVGSKAHKTSAVLSQAWKEDADMGTLLPALFEYFGESMFSFVPAPELSFFL